MGTWDTGAFDNDTAADFAIALDEADPSSAPTVLTSVCGGGADRHAGDTAVRASAPRRGR
ncbi:DUF4259 domain-containing protein [Streptomyces sp. NPDC059697]|uniref:DUF4259 domain-containing protein n=1 Tax=Streptomyces sp. NPDC059697 TaxID=3346912 RepID=UPI0036903D95